MSQLLAYFVNGIMARDISHCYRVPFPRFTRVSARRAPL